MTLALRDCQKVYVILQSCSWGESSLAEICAFSIRLNCQIAWPSFRQWNFANSLCKFDGLFVAIANSADYLHLFTEDCIVKTVN